MKSEKTTLITIFTIFFLLSVSLIYLMIKKDMVTKENQEKRMQMPRENEKMLDAWPKVEIQTRQ